jgi:hypothetical protein
VLEGKLEASATSPVPINSLAPRRCPADLADVGGSELKLDLVGLGVVAGSLPFGLELNAGKAAGFEA